VRKYDGQDTVHFLDPPYTGYNAVVGEGGFDEQRFFNLLKDLKGKFLVTYGVRGKLPKLLKAEGYPIKRIRTPRTLRSMRGVGGSKYLTQIVATNYDLTKKSLDALALDGWEPWEGESPANLVGLFQRERKQPIIGRYVDSRRNLRVQRCLPFLPATRQ
jgi:DNA adenine methylase